MSDIVNYKERNEDLCSASELSVQNIEPSLENFLPLEIWEHVFRGLGSKDFLAVINSLPEWRDILKPQTTSALLPMVLPILLEHVNATDAQLLQTFIPWRAISHGAKRSIDQLLQAESSSPQTHYEYLTGISKSNSLWLKQSQARRLTYFTSKRNTFRNAEDILKFLTHFGEFSTRKENNNPFLTKSISIEIQTGLPELLNPDFVNERRLWILSEYGKHVTAFTCNIVDKLRWHYVHHVLELLENVPNIKILKVGGDLGVLGRQRSELHFPRLKHFELLNLEESCGEKAPLSSPSGERDEDHAEAEPFALGPELVKHYGPQLQTLICRTGLLEAVGVEVFNSRVQNLRCLRVGPVRKSLLDQLSLLELPLLEELQFCKYATIDGTLKLSDFIRAMSRFATTLTHLQILVDLPDYEFTDFQTVDLLIERNDGLIFSSLKNLSTTRFNFHTQWFRIVFPKLCPVIQELHIDKIKEETELELIKGAFQDFRNLEKVEISYYEKGKGNPIKMLVKRN